MKTALLEKIRTELNAQLDRLTRAAMDAHAAATDPDSKAEGKYDTRSLEASYLAAGQARQVEEIAEAVKTLRRAAFRTFPDDPETALRAALDAAEEGDAWRFARFERESDAEEDIA
jgi:hypothetical protein